MNHCSTVNARTHFALFRLAQKFSMQILLLFSIFLSIPAFASLPFCSDIFPNGLSTHGEQTKVYFGRNAQLLNTFNFYIAASELTADYYSPKWTCGEKFCRRVDRDARASIRLTPKEGLSRHDVVALPNKRKTLAKKFAYGRVTVLPHATLLFSPRAEGYKISELTLGHKSKLTIAAGEYWITDLKLHEGSEIEVVGDGTAVLYITNDLHIPKHVKINSKNKKPAALLVYSVNNLSLEPHSQIHAFFYALGEASLEKKAKLHGAIAANSISLAPESSVTFTKNALQNLEFKHQCVGAPPTTDITAPVIELDPFPYITHEPTVTITGTITDPGNSLRWLQTVVLTIGTDAGIALEIDGEGQFSFELPLTQGENSFSIEATDRSPNRTLQRFTVWRDTELEFGIHLEPYEGQIRSMPLNGIITAPEGTVIASAELQTQDGVIDLPLVNNRLMFYPPLKYEANEFVITARDSAGNEVSKAFSIWGAGDAERGPSFTEVIGFNGEIRYTTYFYTLWHPYDNQVYFLSEYVTVKPLPGNLYELSTDIQLHPEVTRGHLSFSSPEGGYEFLYYFYDTYSPDRIYIGIDFEIDQWQFDDPQKILTVTGLVHIPLENIRDNMTLVAVNNRFPGVEYPINLPPWDDLGNARFSVDLPLATGVNELIIKLKKGNDDVVVDLGYPNYSFTAIGE